MKKILILFLFPFIILGQEITLVGDVDCSGDVNSEDASLILQFVTNIIDELPCEENMTGLTTEQLQEIINMMDEQLSINYIGEGGNNYPIMVSSISSEQMTWGNALIYCDDLEEGGYSDWFLPDVDQLTYSVSGGCELPDERTENTLWTRSPSVKDDYYIYTLEESGGGTHDEHWSYIYQCRCVRFGEGDTGEVSSSSSGLGSSGLGNANQPITMIGPMYRYDECDENCFPNALFTHPFPAYQASNITEHRLYFSDAIKFCGQLYHDGYDDWFLPSIKQLTDYIAQGNSVSLSNIIECDNEVCNWEFWTISGTSNSAGITYSSVNYNEQHYLVGFGEGWSYNSYKKCFCVR